MSARQELRAGGGTGREPGFVSSALRPPLSSLGPHFPKLGRVSSAPSAPSAASLEHQAEDGNACTFPARFCGLDGCTQAGGDSVISIPEPSLRVVMSL